MGRGARLSVSPVACQETELDAKESEWGRTLFGLIGTVPSQKQVEKSLYPGGSCSFTCLIEIMRISEYNTSRIDKRNTITARISWDDQFRGLT